MKKVKNTESNTGRLQGATLATTELERKQWHGPYFSSMRLELMKNRQGYLYDGEYILNTKPLQIDMLARRKGEIAWVLDEITKGFRKHNIIEFKSPDDELNLDVFYKTLGYGCLYKAQESRVDEISETEISIAFIRERKPEKLLQVLEKRYGVTQGTRGIYRIETEKLLFPVQILVLHEMEWQQHIWLTALQRKISLEHAKVLVLEMKKLEYPDEREWADSVLQLAMANNKEIFEQMKGEEFMCQALRELMADEINEELYKAEERGKMLGEEQGIRLGEARGEKRGAKTLGELIRRLLNGEDEMSIRKSGANEELLKIAVGVLQKP